MESITQRRIRLGVRAIISCYGIGLRVGPEALGTSPLQRFYQAQDGWSFLDATETDASRLSAVKGLQTANLKALQLDRVLEAWFAELPAAGRCEGTRRGAWVALVVDPLSWSWA